MDGFKNDNNVVYVYNGMELSHKMMKYWMDIKSTVLSEISQMENDKTWMISLICREGILKSNKPTNEKGKKNL